MRVSRVPGGARHRPEPARCDLTWRFRGAGESCFRCLVIWVGPGPQRLAHHTVRRARNTVRRTLDAAGRIRLPDWRAIVGSPAQRCENSGSPMSNNVKRNLSPGPGDCSGIPETAPSSRPRGNRGRTSRQVDSRQDRDLGAVSLLGGVAWTMLAIVRGETVNAIWFVFAAVCTYLIGYRFYSKFIERYIARPDDSRATPAEYKADGKDYVPTDRRVLFGHHFAAIAGAGPLVGRCSPRRWATCPARSGSSSASSSPVPCRTTSCCSSPCAAEAARSVRWPATSSA